MKKIIATLLLVSFFGCQQNQKTNSKVALDFEGGWKLVEFNYFNQDTSVNVPNTSGMFIFGDGSYSVLWTRGVRTPFVDLSNPSDDEIKAAFNSIIFNMGTYEVSNDTIITKSQVARVPGFEGGGYIYKFNRINEDSLQLKVVDEYYPDGTHPEWIKDTKMEFVLVKNKSPQ
jgi:hypothetical protein